MLEPGLRRTIAINRKTSVLLVYFIADRAMNSKPILFARRVGLFVVSRFLRMKYDTVRAGLRMWLCLWWAEELRWMWGED